MSLFTLHLPSLSYSSASYCYPVRPAFSFPPVHFHSCFQLQCLVIWAQTTASVRYCCSYCNCFLFPALFPASFSFVFANKKIESTISLTVDSFKTALDTYLLHVASMTSLSHDLKNVQGLAPVCFSESEFSPLTWTSDNTLLFYMVLVTSLQE